MHPLTRWALAARSWADQPRRWRRRRRWEASGRAPVIVLAYRRVANDRPNSWTILEDQFERQIRWLRRRFDLVDLEQAQRRLRSGRNGRQAVSITFDDGYADNMRFALPLLNRLGVPCTYFVSLAQAAQRTPFPHDAARGEDLAPNSIEELREIADGGVEIGARTRTYADLGRTTDRVALHDEVVTASEELQRLVGRPVRYFSFPYGKHENLNRAAFDLAFETGFEAVCSCYGGHNTPGDDPFHLQRIAVGGDFVRFQNWLSGDPRLLRRVRRYAYETLQAPPAPLVHR